MTFEIFFPILGINSGFPWKHESLLCNLSEKVDGFSARSLLGRSLLSFKLLTSQLSMINIITNFAPSTFHFSPCWVVALVFVELQDVEKCKSLNWFNLIGSL